MNFNFTINEHTPIRREMAAIFTASSCKETGYLGHVHYINDKPVGYYIHRSARFWIEIPDFMDKLYEEVYTLRQTQYQEEKLFS